MTLEWIDTHAHLDEDAFENDRTEVVARSQEAGVVSIVTIGTTLASSRTSIELAGKFPIIHAAVGIQPNYVAEAQPGDWDSICELVNQPQVVAIGETGLDRYWDYAPFDLQVEYFRKHIQLASEHQLPFIVHCREAEDDVVSELRRAADEQGQPLHGVMHSFCGDVKTAQDCLELGLHISFAGMLTYKKNDELRETAASIPLDRLLVETDSPYLSPVPKRGKRNEPAHVVHTAECLASLFDLPLSNIASHTTANARNVFNLK
ncbi:MAG: TatD family hydrolase [Planctomycetaceae bacterium]